MVGYLPQTGGYFQKKVAYLKCIFIICLVSLYYQTVIKHSNEESAVDYNLNLTRYFIKKVGEQNNTRNNLNAREAKPFRKL